MLLRKKLGGGRLVDVAQPGLERVLCLTFEAFNELGDRVTIRLYAEIMGRYSNIIITDENDIIIDAIHRVDASMSSQRLVLPGIKYTLPPFQDKLNLLECHEEQLFSRVIQDRGQTLSKAILNGVQGVSPIVCRELAHLAAYGKDERLELLSENILLRAASQLKKLKSVASEASGRPFIVKSPEGAPIDFSFMDIMQYGLKGIASELANFSALLDVFYAQKDSSERMRIRAHDLLQVLASNAERVSRKLNLQRAELESSANRDTYRVYGDLLNSNLYKLSKGEYVAELENFYTEGEMVRIPLDPTLTPAQNAQRYYRDYRKAATAEKMLTELITQGEAELEYIETVFDALSRATTERELGEIRAELAEQGYIRRQKTARRPPAAMPPIELSSTDGFTILVGRNNRQNDRLTLKESSKQDIWLHAQRLPGAHVIIVTNGAEVPAKTMEEAAALAAQHSRASGGGLVPVDYTRVKNVKKPQGAKPGMVIYEQFKTIFVKGY
jgi:predicted ribosome quality control (RQC) complex YloA/Tae2 family protein